LFEDIHKSQPRPPTPICRTAQIIAAAIFHEPERSIHLARDGNHGIAEKRQDSVRPGFIEDPQHFAAKPLAKGWRV